MKDTAVDNLEQRVAKAIGEELGHKPPNAYTFRAAKAAITAVREWDKEQASAAVRAEHEGNRTVEGSAKP